MRFSSSSSTAGVGVGVIVVVVVVVVAAAGVSFVAAATGLVPFVTVAAAAVGAAFVDTGYDSGSFVIMQMVGKVVGDHAFDVAAGFVAVVFAEGGLIVVADAAVVAAADSEPSQSNLKAC